MTTESKEQKKLGQRFIFAMWLAGLVLIFFLFSNILKHDKNPNQIVNLDETSEGTKVVTLKRNRYGHYVTKGFINNVEVIFFIDTGATDISIPEAIAKKIKLTRGPEQVYNTANGRIVNYLTNLKTVGIGNIVLNNIRASINPNMESDEILLGMSFLKKIEFTQRGDTLILRQ